MVVKRRHLVLTHEHDLLGVNLAALAALRRPVAQGKQRQAQRLKAPGVEIRNVPPQPLRAQLIRLAAPSQPFFRRPIRIRRQHKPVLREKRAGLANAPVDLRSLHPNLLAKRSSEKTYTHSLRSPNSIAPSRTLSHG